MLTLTDRAFFRFLPPPPLVVAAFPLLAATMAFLSASVGMPHCSFQNSCEKT